MERSNVSRIESGRVNITIKTLCIMSSALEVSILDLIGTEFTDKSNL
ncbi:MAG: helix-turn-helix transcriptional regulator [Rikenellaceae bacterium]